MNKTALLAQIITILKNNDSSKTEKENTMTKTEQIMQKLGFFAFSPLKVKDEKELKEPKGYAKEYINRNTGATAGMLVGMTGGAGIGAGLGSIGRTSNAAEIGVLTGMLAGGITGGITGDVRSLRKTEREAGVKPTGVGKYLGRSLGSVITGTILPIPVVGGAVGDYTVSRHLTEYKKQRPTEVKKD